MIANRAEELGGPFLGSGSKLYDKYRPYIVTVAPGEEGVWEIDFMSLGDGTNHATGATLGANDNWIQAVATGSSALISAWDVSVADATNNIKTGRVYTTMFVGTAQNSVFSERSFMVNSMS